MSTQTTNFDLTLYEGSDLFNPLSVENGNTTKIDNALFDVQNLGVTTATEVTTGTTHALTRVNPNSAMFRFVATSAWGVGDTCTVDGVQVSTLTVAGTSLPNGAWVINSNVLCCIVGTVLTVFASTLQSEAGDIDADTLDGHAADYFATAEQLAAKADKSIASSVQLTVAGWVVSGSGYSQTVTAAQVTADSNLVISPAVVNFDEAVSAGIRATSQSQNSITFYATSIPSASIYMNVLVVG